MEKQAAKSQAERHRIIGAFYAEAIQGHEKRKNAGEACTPWKVDLEKGEITFKNMKWYFRRTLAGSFTLTAVDETHTDSEATVSRLPYIPETAKSFDKIRPQAEDAVAAINESIKNATNAPSPLTPRNASLEDAYRRIIEDAKTWCNDPILKVIALQIPEIIPWNANCNIPENTTSRPNVERPSLENKRYHHFLVAHYEKNLSQVTFSLGKSYSSGREFENGEVLEIAKASHEAKAREIAQSKLEEIDLYDGTLYERDFYEDGKELLNKKKEFLFYPIFVAIDSNVFGEERKKITKIADEGKIRVVSTESVIKEVSSPKTPRDCRTDINGVLYWSDDSDGRALERH